MSDVKLVIERSRALESLLESKFNAEGQGLHKKVSDVEELLSPNLVKQLRSVASLRNKVMHEAGFSLPNRDAFIRACDQVEAAIAQLPANKKAKRIRPFIIPIYLQTYTTEPRFGSSVVVLSAITGEVIEFRELPRSPMQATTLQSSKDQTVSLKLPDGQKQQFEFRASEMQANPGHVLTLLMGLCEGRNELLAVYNHSSQMYYYSFSGWREFLPRSIGSEIPILFAAILFIVLAICLYIWLPVSYFLIFQPFVFFFLMMGLTPVYFAIMAILKGTMEVLPTPLPWLRKWVGKMISSNAILKRIDELLPSPIPRFHKHMDSVIYNLANFDYSK